MHIFHNFHSILLLSISKHYINIATLDGDNKKEALVTVESPNPNNVLTKFNFTMTRDSRFRLGAAGATTYNKYSFLIPHPNNDMTNFNFTVTPCSFLIPQKETKEAMPPGTKQTDI